MIRRLSSHGSKTKLKLKKKSSSSVVVVKEDEISTSTAAAAALETRDDDDTQLVSTAVEKLDINDNEQQNNTKQEDDEEDEMQQATNKKGFAANFKPSILPKSDPSTWKHKPVYLMAGSTMSTPGIKEHEALPIGVPFEVETSLFKGKVLLRFRNTKSDDPTAHEKYFNGRKRLMQSVLQGTFKKPMKMSEVYTGSVFAYKMKNSPPSSMAKVMTSILGRVAPGLIMDLTSDSPKVLAILAGSAQTLSIDSPGNEPDITLPNIEENVVSSLGSSGGSSGDVSNRTSRRKTLGNPKKAAEYEFNTHDVYTFHLYDDAMDYGNGTMKIPMYGDVDIKPHIGKYQPLGLNMVTKDGEFLFDIRVWHEFHVKEE